MQLSGFTLARGGVRIEGRHQQLVVRAAATAVVKAPTALVARGGKSRAAQQAEQRVLDAVEGTAGRGKDGLPPDLMRQFEEAVAALEADGGVRAPTRSPLLDGRWRLIFTTRPGSASPIQRGFTAVDAFKVYQEISVVEQQGGEEEGEAMARVNNVVQLGSAGVLKVMAEANTDSRPIPGFKPRRGAGLPLFGKSAAYPPAGPDLRIDFAFDYAFFDLRALPVRIPYPVPFKLLGDETKGWIDITYLSPDGTFRLSRGNKGTLFVLVKDDPPRERLLSALAAGPSRSDEVARIVQQLEERQQAGGGGSDGALSSPARSPLAEGRWRLRWSQQAASANPLQRALADTIRNFQVVRGGRLDNIVEFAPFLRVRAGAACAPASATRTAVTIDEVELQLGPLRIPLNAVRAQAEPGYIDWLYLDESGSLRVTRGNRGSLFVHTRDDEDSSEEEEDT